MFRSAVKDRLDLLLCVAAISYLTYCQDAFVCSVIFKSTLTFGGLYAILRTTRICHPPKSKSNLNSNSNANTNTNTNTNSHTNLEPHLETEWTARLVSTVHAVYLTVGSVYCFLQFPHYTATEMWVMNKAAHADDLAVMRAATFTCAFAGYLQWDLLWHVSRRNTNTNTNTTSNPQHVNVQSDPSAILHHILYVLMTHYLLHGEEYVFARPYAWLSFAELSTPFLHWRWFLLTMGRKESVWCNVASVCFALTFLFTRIICYTLGLIDLWWVSHWRIWSQLPWGIYLVVAGIHGGFALNLFWAEKVVKGLLKIYRTLKSKKGS